MAVSSGVKLRISICSFIMYVEERSTLDYKLFKIIICGYNLTTCDANVSSTDHLRDIKQDALLSQKPTKFHEVHLNAFLYVRSFID